MGSHNDLDAYFAGLVRCEECGIRWYPGSIQPPRKTCMRCRTSEPLVSASHMADMEARRHQGEINDAVDALLSDGLPWWRRLLRRLTRGAK